MLRIIKRASILWPVTAEIPKGDGTKESEPFEFKISYKLLGVADFKCLSDKMASGEQISTADYVLGWEDVQDESGAALAFSPDSLSQALDVRQIAEAISLAFWEAQAGADEKN